MKARHAISQWHSLQAALFLSICLLLPATAAQQATCSGQVSEVSAVGMTVSDLDRSMEFYSRVLGFEKISEVEVSGDDYEHLEGVFGLRMRVARMRLGEEFIELLEFVAPKGRPRPAEMRSNDRTFQHIALITGDMERAYARLRKNKIEHISPGPQRLPDWNKNAGGIQAFYFRDPDGHPLEVLAFPMDKGNPKWHRLAAANPDRLFLGIDHTAIGVSDTESSLRFYRDTLGFRVAGESDNYGIEQERLNNVFGAHLRITGLRAPAGPGIEFLEYLTPRDGRLAPADLKANDLVWWQTRLATPDAICTAQGVRAGHYAIVSGSVVTTADDKLGFHKAALVRDPDGHAFLLAEK